jgi:hypothetical protein
MNSFIKETSINLVFDICLYLVIVFLTKYDLVFVTLLTLFISQTFESYYSYKFLKEIKDNN